MDCVVFLLSNSRSPHNPRSNNARTNHAGSYSPRCKLYTILVVDSHRPLECPFWCIVVDE